MRCAGYVDSRALVLVYDWLIANTLILAQSSESIVILFQLPRLLDVTATSADGHGHSFSA